jgi:PIN domain nuclease of toxin-antitoxin system
VNILLDTHVVLWAFGDPARLGERARAAITDPRNSIAVSAASIWEIEIKRALGMLTAPAGAAALCRERDFDELQITFDHAEAAAALPLHHSDPFDRMLIGQAVVDGFHLMSADRILATYGVATVDPTI